MSLNAGSVTLDNADPPNLVGTGLSLDIATSLRSSLDTFSILLNHKYDYGILSIFVVPTANVLASTIISHITAHAVVSGTSVT
jgi:hypothetical protein